MPREHTIGEYNIIGSKEGYSEEVTFKPRLMEDLEVSRKKEAHTPFHAERTAYAKDQRQGHDKGLKE